MSNDPDISYGLSLIVFYGLCIAGILVTLGIQFVAGVLEKREVKKFRGVNFVRMEQRGDRQGAGFRDAANSHGSAWWATQRHDCNSRGENNVKEPSEEFENELIVALQMFIDGRRQKCKLSEPDFVGAVKSALAIVAHRFKHENPDRE